MIQKLYTPLRKLVFVFFTFLGLFLLLSFVLPQDSPAYDWLQEYGNIMLVFGAFIAALWIITYYNQRYRITHRGAAIAAVAGQYNALLADNPLRSPIFAQLALRDATFLNQIAADDWRYGDHQHTLYARTKNGEYKAAFVYYSILELDLPRRLPHIVFDSQKSHRKQLGALFDRTQLHHLEGDFDRHFATYFPKFYSIDGLSIITPEVMRAMIAADQFDIEIYGNKLYLYGPLMPISSLPTMIEQGKLIRQKLLNNILTYRDEMLGKVDRTKVASFGARLRPNPYKGLPSIATGLALIALFAYLQYNGRASIEALIFGSALVGNGLYSIWKVKRESREVDALYRTALSARKFRTTASADHKKH